MIKLEPVRLESHSSLLEDAIVMPGGTMGRGAVLLRRTRGAAHGHARREAHAGGQRPCPLRALALPKGCWLADAVAAR